MNRRIFVENNPSIITEAEILLKELTTTLHTETLKSLRLISVYDFFKLEEGRGDDAVHAVCDPRRAELLEEGEILQLLNQHPHFTIESLPGQFDQRADILMETLRLKGIEQPTQVSTALLYLFNEDLSDAEFEKIQNYLFNPIDTRLKDLTKAINSNRFEDNREPQPVPEIKDFIHMSESRLTEFKLEQGLAMEFADLKHIQQYFKNEERRNPTETEILVLDTYWSDHCRHTTFETELTKINFSESQFEEQLQTAYENYLALREATGITDRPETLMDMGTIFGRYQRKTGELSDMEISDEVNACSIRIDVDVDGKKEPWLLMFKNETHNHPTEIEPFGGASTCVGGAIRDPLSGRAYVYQAMRITGAGNVLEPMEETLEGKLPQRKISKTAAIGNSSYGNQIGAATSFAKEFYHPGFVAKRMEVGAVVGAVPEAQVVRKAPVAGDVIIMLGGKTGRDGVGGATGSSQVQTVETIDTAGSEVQKGSPIEERKILRLFRKPHVTQMIKKSNDFGAGGVSVAIGELADGVEVNLDVVPVKYAGLNGTELAISESQERMAVVVSKEDAAKFIEEAEKESVLAVEVAKVTEEPRLVIKWRDEKIVDIARSFLDTNGIRKAVEVNVVDSNRPSPLMMRKVLDDLDLAWRATMAEYNNASQKGMQSLFDSNLGGSTVLNPYGGEYQLTPAEASVQKIQVEKGFTNSATILSHGYHPYIGEWSPFHGASYAVIESIARIVATGGEWRKSRLSFQEYFERLDNSPEKFGKPVAALLGSIEAQRALNIPSIGGKDSMSGSFNDIHVPPTLISFAVCPTQTDRILSPEFKAADQYLYLLPVKETTSAIPYHEMIENFDQLQKLNEAGTVTSAIALRHGGIAKALAVMSFGNRIGAKIGGISAHDLFRPQYGGFLFTTKERLEPSDHYQLLGETDSKYQISFESQVIECSALEEAYRGRFEPLFPTEIAPVVAEALPSVGKKLPKVEMKGAGKARPVAYIPIFPGTHSEYETAKAVEKAGGEVNLLPFRTLNRKMIEASIDEMASSIDQADLFILSGGFSTTDEAAGTGTYMATILEHPSIQKSITQLIERGGLILGLNAGFHALVKTGLLPYGTFKAQEELAIVMNDSAQHRSEIVATRVVNAHTPWFNEEELDKIYQLPFATKEGKVVVTDECAKELIEKGQIAMQYVDREGAPTLGEGNPSGSALAIDAITSENGQILGKITQNERYESGLLLNIGGERYQPLFDNAIAYLKGE